MILKVNKDICEIKQNEVWNVGDYNVHTVEVELSEEFDGLVNKVRYFVEDNSYDMLITSNVAQVPYEATLTEGTIKIGVYGYDADTNILVQSTSPVNKYISSGTYTGEADNTESLTPTDKQQMESAIQKNTDDIIDLQNNKQDVLISGQNIKTINNESLLGEGNINIQSSREGGTSNYADLINKPKINNVELKGNKSLNDLGIQPAGNYALRSELPTVPINVSSFTNDAGYTTNIGTITSIKMNGNTISSSGEANLGTVITEHQDISGKQDVEDNRLLTTNKIIYGAINEVNSIAKGANQALAFTNYSRMIELINDLNNTWYKLGQNIYIQTLEVPDLWISGIEPTSVPYTYINDATIINELKNNGYIQVGYYKLSMLETQKVDLTNYVTNTDYATSSTGGVVKVSVGDYGLNMDSGVLKGVVKTYSQYGDMSSKGVVTKGTFENVITGKGLIDSSYHDNTKQDVLVSGTNIKTINNTSILGSGNIDIQGGGGTTVQANPTLDGTEGHLDGLKVGNTKYSTRPDLSGKVISIMGDSISTYAGWIPNSQGINDGTGTLKHAIYYPDYGSYLNNVNMTWWHKLIFDKFKAKLGINESWSGSFVGNNKDTNSATTTTCHGNDTGPDTCMAGNTRIKRLSANGTPDIIYVYGGTNDIAQPGTPGESLGTFNSSTDYSTVDITTRKWTYFVDAYRTMIQRMQYYYPKAKVIALLPTYCNTYYNRAKLDEWVEQIKLICDYFGVNYIDLRACGITWANSSSSRNAKGVQTLGDSNIHPNDLGHTMIADYVESETYKILQQDYIENEVYTVTNNLSTLTNTMSYVTGVTKGESYSATLTGSDLTVCRVYMGETDITSTVYNSSTGIISISNVTGDITINEGEPIITPVTGVILNASTKSIMPNDVETLTATIIPGNATNKNVTWSVNNNHVTITPNGLSCTVTGASNGTSVVTVTTEDGNFTATCTFTIHEIVLESIAITTPPSTTAYHYGDTFSKTGMVVTASYDDNTSEVLDDTDYTVSPSGPLTDSDTTITVSYTYNGVTKTATQAITVATLSSITVTTQPTKTDYITGETFDPTGMIVTATWSNNTTSTVTNYTYSPSSNLSTTDTTITISYTVGGVTRTTTQAIIVVNDINFEYTQYNKSNTSVTTIGTFWNTNWSAMQKAVGKTINSITIETASPGVLTVRGYDGIIDRTAIYSSLQQRAITADSEGFDMFILNLSAGVNTYMLDGTDNRVTIINQSAINSCPNTIGLVKAGDTGTFKYQNQSELPNLDGPTFIYNLTSNYNNRQVLGFTLNVTAQTI